MKLQVGSSRLAAARQQVCGDSLHHLPCAGRQAPADLLVAIDGLGHGQDAAFASTCALQALQQLAAGRHWPAEPVQLLRLLDEPMHDSRGAAMGAALIEDNVLHYAAVGNTRAFVWHQGHIQRLYSTPGILGDGHWLRRPMTAQSLTLQTGDWLLLYTDGLHEHITLPAIDATWRDQPRLLCEALLRDWRGADDDAGVMAAYCMAP